MSVGAAHLYVIGSDDMPYVKIGTSVDPHKRLRLLQTGSPFTLSVLWSCEMDHYLERDIHEVFADFRVRGEWFDLTPLGDSVVAVQRAVETARAKPSAPTHLVPAPRGCVDPEGCWDGPCMCRVGHPYILS